MIDSARRLWASEHFLAKVTRSANPAFDWTMCGAGARFIDVRTPKFVRTGDSLAPNAGAEAGVRWSAANSTISRVSSFSRHIAVVHVRTKVPPDYVFGQQLGFHTLMNVYATDGTLLQADVELPDLAVGQDKEGVFVVQYDRGRNASSAATLLHVPVS